MKYEMIFGDEGLFDSAGLFTGIDVVTRNIDDGLYRTSRLSECTPSSLRINPIVAMRRIIKTPVISGDIDDLIKDEFSEWWEKEGCLVRSGGGDRERTFAFAAFRKLMPEILAARGLKKTPVWTVVDQLAGRLPEVGVKVALNLSDEVVKSSAIQSWENGDELEVLRTFKKDEPNVEYASALFNLRTKTCGLVLTKYLSPIETPAEKAQREEDEFVSALYREDVHDVTFEQGARAAYRKLKGGE